MTTYTVHVAREGDQWTAQVDQLPAAHTWAGNLTRLDHDVREAIALVEDLPDGAEHGLDLDWDFSAVGTDAAQAAQIAQERRRALSAAADATARAHQTVQHLADAGWSQRDISGLLGLTPGRVSQVLQEARERRAA